MLNEYYRTLDERERDWLISTHDFATHGECCPYETCSCSFSSSLREKKENMGENELPQERIEDADEYKKIFNDEITAVSAITDVEVLDRIHTLESVIRQARTRLQASNFTLNERKKKMNKEEREELAKRDREYKIKPETTEPKKERAAPMSKDEKAVHEVMKMLKMDYETAKKWIEENG